MTKKQQEHQQNQQEYAIAAQPYFERMGYKCDLLGPYFHGWCKPLNKDGREIIVTGTGENENDLPPPDGPFAVCYYKSEGEPIGYCEIGGEFAKELLPHVLETLEGIKWMAVRAKE